MVRNVVWMTILYGSEVWTLHERNINSANATKMRYLRKIEGITSMDRVSNDVVRELREHLKIDPIYNKFEAQWR